MKIKATFLAIFFVAVILGSCEKRNNELQQVTQQDVTEQNGLEVDEQQLAELQLDEQQLAELEKYTNSTQKSWGGDRPFLIVGRSVATGAGDKCGPDLNEDGIPDGWTLYYEGKGIATWMGMVNYTGINCNLAPCVNGYVTATDRRGNTLNLVAGPDFPVCVVDPPRPLTKAYAGPGYIDGGTGKFADATGSIEWYLVMDLDPESPNFRTVLMTAFGTINY